ncbi:MAG: distal tail protein Dit [Paraclostridium sp.]
MEFIFNGRSSKEFNLKITESNHASVPFRNIEEVNVPGRNGNIVVDDMGYSNRTIELSVLLDNRDGGKTLCEMARELSSWLQSSKAFKKLTFSDDTDCYLEAMCINQISFEELAKDFNELQITFLCKPFKKINSGNTEILVAQNSFISNRFLPSKPLIKIVGTGDITLNINSQAIVLKGLEGGIEIDSELMNAYKIVEGKTVLQNSKMYSDFPILESGRNTISWTGNVTQLKVTPRWAVL